MDDFGKKIDENYVEIISQGESGIWEFEISKKFVVLIFYII